MARKSMGSNWNKEVHKNLSRPESDESKIPNYWKLRWFPGAFFLSNYTARNTVAKSTVYRQRILTRFYYLRHLCDESIINNSGRNTC